MMMKPITTAVLVLSSFAAPATAGVAAATQGGLPSAEGQLAGSSIFLGTWQLDLTNMPVTYGTAPKRVTYTISDVGNGRWQTAIEIVMAEGPVRHMLVQYRRDGLPSPSAGDKMEGDTAAVNSPASNVLVMSLAKDKGLESVRVYAVSNDGRTMTESAADVDDEGKPFVRNFTFRRVK